MTELASRPAGAQLLPGAADYTIFLDTRGQTGAGLAADYVVWRDNLGSSTALPNDDTTGVGPDDSTRWKTNFGQTLGGGSGATAKATVPEPTTLVLLTLAAAGWFLRRRRAG